MAKETETSITPVRNQGSGNMEYRAEIGTGPDRLVRMFQSRAACKGWFTREAKKVSK